MSSMYIRSFKYISQFGTEILVGISYSPGARGKFVYIFSYRAFYDGLLLGVVPVFRKVRVFLLYVVHFFCIKH